MNGPPPATTAAVPQIAPLAKYKLVFLGDQVRQKSNSVQKKKKFFHFSSFRSLLSFAFVKNRV
jgi:hypothetical protein